MGRKYRNIWNAKKMTINFNLKEWRQDLAAYVREKKYWYDVRVTKARSYDENFYNKGIKTFEIFNVYGGNIKVAFKDENKIIDSSDEELIKKYLEDRRTVL